MSLIRRVRESRHRELDAVSFLSWYLVAVFAIESRYIIGPLGGAGTPAQVVAVAGIGWWLYFHTARATSTGSGVQPVRIALLVFFLSYLASYIEAMSRPITAVESSGATLGMVGLAGWLGLALLANDGIPDHDRFDTLLRRLVLAGTLLAALGVAQFVFHTSLIRWFTIPGLQTNLPLGDLMSRSGFTRPAGTALHPIEFGAVLTTICPLAIAMARTSPVGRRLWRWVSVFLILLGIVVSGSRSAFLSTIVAVIVMGAVWSPLTRLRAAVAGIALIGFVAVAFPGMSGSMLNLFTGFSEDGSIQSRTGSYDIAGQFFERSPWFGRGGSTFLPSYRIFDNQYLLTLIETGLVGLLALLGLFVTAFLCARAARRISATPARAETAQGIAAGVAAAATGFATYDGMSFPMGTGILFLMVGLGGAAWRLAREARDGEREPDAKVKSPARARGRFAPGDPGKPIVT
jgi:O-antigen ligase